MPFFRSSPAVKWRVLFAIFVGIVVVTQVSGCGEPSSDVSSPRSTTTSANPSAFVPLLRNAHPLARPEAGLGPLDANKRISNLSLVFKLSPQQLADREALKAAQLDPSSPNYQKWLTPEEYAARFGANVDDIARAEAWLAGQGLDVHARSRLGARVTFSGSVASLQNAFRTDMRRYQVGLETHYAMANAPSIPSELADVVLAVHNTHDFFARPMGRRNILPQATLPGGGLALGPADWAAIYNVTKLYTDGVAGTPIDGSGVTIVVVGNSLVEQTDIDAFRTTFGLPSTHLTKTLVPNTGAPEYNSSDAEEGESVAEWAGGIAKGATVNYVYTGANDTNVEDATDYAIEENAGSILSVDWEWCEPNETPADADVLDVFASAANLLGITYVAATGGWGPEGCNALALPEPASYPGVTAVGGTEFPAGAITYDASGAALGYGTSEEVWNEDPNLGGGVSGGGISGIFLRPFYQSGVPTCDIIGSLPPSVNPANMREIPDVAVTAGTINNPYLIEVADGTSPPRLSTVGGTSSSVSAFAGVIALVSQATGGHRLGNINPLLYTLQNSNPSAFHDITTGDNEVPCSPDAGAGCSAGGKRGFAAKPGYDCATGLGSVDVYNLVSAWAALAPTTTTVFAPASTTEGASVNLTATVYAATGTNPISGTLTFALRSNLADGGFDKLEILGDFPISGGNPTTEVVTFNGSIPPGLVNPAAPYVDVVAMYSGDSHHLASQSAAARIAFPQGDSGTDAATDSGTTADAGAVDDSGPDATPGANADSGADSGNVGDSGTTGEAGPVADSGTQSDSGNDAALADATAEMSDGALASADDAGPAPDGGVANDGGAEGCGCTMAGRQVPTTGMLAALVACMLGVGERRRAARRSRSRRGLRKISSVNP